MKFNDATQKLAVGTLIAYSLYSFGTMGVVGILATGALILIAAALLESIEFVAIGVIITGLLYTYVAKRYLSTREGFSGSQPEITARINQMKANAQNTIKAPVGVYDPAIEGFQGVSSGSDADDEAGESSSSKPAPKDLNQGVDSKAVSASLTKGKEKGDAVGDLTQNLKETFGDSSGASLGLFKLGELPSESGSGPHIDASSTLMKAMNALKPEQVSAMTADTKKLMETQKGLMSMLQSMRPVLEDGRQLLDTFSGIFGSGSTKAFGEFKLGA